MNILCLGDLVGKPGRQALRELLPQIKKEFSIDLTIVNAEIAAGGSGITERLARLLFGMGVDVITLGDHVWDRPEINEYLSQESRILRPANFPPGAPGKGWCLVELPSGQKVAVINLLGRVFMRYNVDCPFRAFQGMIEEIRKETKIILVDMHAETTSEKVAFGHFSDGKVSAVFGTHTHIQTADEAILSQGTAYITDLGMTGPYNSVIGQDKGKIINRFVQGLPVRFEVAKEDIRVAGAVIVVDEKTGKATQITRLQRKAALTSEEQGE